MTKCEKNVQENLRFVLKLKLAAKKLKKVNPYSKIMALNMNLENSICEKVPTLPSLAVL